MTLSPALLLTGYCVVIVAVSLAGGWLPRMVRLTHRRLHVVLSFVSGVMLGVALLHLLPDALAEHEAWLQATHDHADHAVEAAGAAGHDHGTVERVMLWMIGGFLLMFMLERWFCYHHHDAPGEGDEDPAQAGCGHAGHEHRLTWTGATVGLTVHSLIAGAALAASVAAEAAGGRALAGLGTFLMIVLHKPFDSLTIGTLLVAGGRSRRLHLVVNLLFGLVVPVGVGLVLLAGPTGPDVPHRFLSDALAFSAGTFLCIALSDLLPELQFHRHDRIKLTAALVLGLLVSWLIG